MTIWIWILTRRLGHSAESDVVLKFVLSVEIEPDGIVTPARAVLFCPDTDDKFYKVLGWSQSYQLMTYLHEDSLASIIHD
jgi:hypothetical protein